jgi:hypothetical protein
MRKALNQLITILDGVPVIKGTRSTGQSLVELALITPILIIIVMALIELGWFANNYIILLETTRVGARMGTTLVDDSSPLEWINLGSPYPGIQPPSTAPDDQEIAWRYAYAVRLCGSQEASVGFYSRIACKMLEVMAPLEFRGELDPTVGTVGNGVDEIIISAFPLQAVNPTSFDQAVNYYQLPLPPGSPANTVNPNPQIPRVPNAPSMWDSVRKVAGFPVNEQQVLVVGRYPTNANECTANATGTTQPVDTQDPFNYINYTGTAYTAADSTGDTWRNYLEIDPQAANVDPNLLWLEIPGYDNTVEYQRGWVYNQQHAVIATRGNAVGQRCFGSEFSVGRVQELLNLSGFNLAANDAANASRRRGLPSGGVVLVEMYWRHTLLLQNPIWNPVFVVLYDPTVDTPNPSEAGTVMSVWAAFPLSSVEPNIRYMPELTVQTMGT